MSSVPPDELSSAALDSPIVASNIVAKIDILLLMNRVLPEDWSNHLHFLREEEFTLWLRNCIEALTFRISILILPIRRKPMASSGFTATLPWKNGPGRWEPHWARPW